jgi:hypothetical protein
VQKNKWKHIENKYINKFQLATIQHIPSHKLKILKTESQHTKKIIYIYIYRFVHQPCTTSTAMPKFNLKKLAGVDAAQGDHLPVERTLTQGRDSF